MSHKLVLPDKFSGDPNNSFVFYNGMLLTSPGDYDIQLRGGLAPIGSALPKTKRIMEFKIKMRKGDYVNLSDNGWSTRFIYEFDGNNFVFQQTGHVQVNVIPANMPITTHKPKYKIHVNKLKLKAPKVHIFDLPWKDPFAANSEPAPKNNDGRTRCFWCNVPTNKIEGFSNIYDICLKCGK